VTPGRTIIAALWLIWIQCHSRPHPRSAPSRHCVGVEVVSTPEEKTSEADDESIHLLERNRARKKEGKKGKTFPPMPFYFVARS